jgi:hypothetical protein
MKTVISLDKTMAENLLFYTQAKTTRQGIYQAIEEYIRYKQRQELLALRGTIDIEDNWQQLRELEKNT